MRLLSRFLLLVQGLAAQTLFTQTSNPPFSAGASPYLSVLRDFNGDGIPDLAFAGNSLTVLLGDGKGGFFPAPGGPYSGGGGAVAMVAADFNSDGWLDIAIEYNQAGPNHPLQGSIFVFLGDGAGGFTPYSGNSFSASNEILTGGGPGSMAAGDFNNDTIPDLVISNENGLVILQGDGSGGFNRVSSPSGRGAQTGQIAVANFTGNGQSDIAVVNTQGLTVFVCDGKGGFTSLPILVLPPVPGGSPIVGAGAVITADFNSDGFVDLAVATNDDLHPSVSILLGDGKGGFTVKPLSFASTNYSSQPLASADFDGDGNPDLVVTGLNDVTVLLGIGDGTFNPQPAFQLSRSKIESDLTVVGDFNRDGKPDLLLSDGRVWLNALQSITLSPKSVSFLASTKPVPVAITPSAGVTATSNQPWLTYANGAVSANAANLAPGNYRGKIVFTGASLFGAIFDAAFTVNAPSGALTAASASPLMAEGGALEGDFNGDGKLDLLVSGSDSLTVWFGDGTGNFTPSLPQSFGVIGLLALADFNLDGHLDIAVIQENAADSIFEFHILFGNGAGGFTDHTTIPAPQNRYPIGFPQPLVADFNLDGIPDLWIGGIVYLGTGKGDFQELAPRRESTTLPIYAVIGDFNRDGIPDVAFTNATSSVDILLGDGTGTLTLSQRFDFGKLDTALGPLTVGDWNGDGVPDLAISSLQQSGVAEILLGNGDGTFAKGTAIPSPIPVATPPDVTVPNYIHSLYAADFNGDGVVDLALSYPFQTGIFLGDGQGGFSQGPLIAGFGIFSPGDYNGDGRVDVANLLGDGLDILLGSLAQPSMTLTEVPASPFDIGETVTLIAKVPPDPNGFQAPTGKITLSDGSATILTAPLVNGTAYLTTPFVPRTHNFTAAYSGDPRNAAAHASLTVVEIGPPAAIQAVANVFPLQALVTDANKNPVPGVRVMFSAPTSGAGGSFLGGASASVLTDLKGIATAPLFIPNAITGPYTITATTTIGGFSCSFAEMN